MLVLGASPCLVTRHSTLDTFNLCRDEPLGSYAPPGLLLGADARDLGAGCAGVHRTTHAGAVLDLDAGRQGGIERLVAVGHSRAGDCVAFGPISTGISEVTNQPAGPSRSLRRGGIAIRSYFAPDRITALAATG